MGIWVAERRRKEALQEAEIREGKMAGGGSCGSGFECRIRGVVCSTRKGG